MQVIEKRKLQYDSEASLDLVEMHVVIPYSIVVTYYHKYTTVNVVKTKASWTMSSFRLKGFVSYTWCHLTFFADIKLPKSWCI